MSNKRERWPVRIAAALIALFAVAAVGCSGCSGGDGGRDSGTGGGDDIPETVTRCCTEVAPGGYLKIDDDCVPTECSEDPVDCGNTTGIKVRNKCTYQRYDNKNVGNEMSICNDQAIPTGWTQVGTDWSPTKCGDPPDSSTQNVLKIKRVS